MQLRHKSKNQLKAASDRLSVLRALILGLRSEGLARKLVVSHGKCSHDEVPKATLAVQRHADLAIAFLESGSDDKRLTAFLPLYYSMLNLAKVLIILRGRRAELMGQKTHGASWSGIHNVGPRTSILTDEITLFERGAIPLFYKSVTGNPYQTHRGVRDRFPVRRLQGRDYLPFVRAIGFEVRHSLGVPARWIQTEVHLRPHSASRERKWKVVVSPTGHYPNRRQLPIVAGLHQQGDQFVSKARAIPVNTAPRDGFPDFPWHLVCLESEPTFETTWSPLGSPSVHMFEGFPVFLAFFHLGSIVRYDPEWLARLSDSESITLLYALLGDGFYSFLRTTWSAIVQQELIVHT